MLSDVLNDAAESIQSCLIKSRRLSEEEKEQAWAIIRLMDTLRLTPGMDLPPDAPVLTAAQLEQIHQERRRQVEELDLIQQKNKIVLPMPSSVQ